MLVIVYPITYCWGCYETMTKHVDVPFGYGHIQFAWVLLWYSYKLDLFVEISAAAESMANVDVVIS